jgi:hypothetical protein
MDFDAALAEEALGRIIADPNAHRQEEWRCETGMCFAGHAAQAAGFKWVNPRPTGWGFEDALIEMNGGKEHVSEVMTKRLGLSDREADILFYSDNKLEDLQGFVKNLANGRPIDEGMSHTSASADHRPEYYDEG